MGNTARETDAPHNSELDAVLRAFEVDDSQTERRGTDRVSWLRALGAAKSLFLQNTRKSGFLTEPSKHELATSATRIGMVAHLLHNKE
jgi:hypothetical protein